MTLLRYFWNRIVLKFEAMISPSVILSFIIFLSPLSTQRADHLQAEISNGLMTARVYLPDPCKGYYRSTRFDWSGAVCSLQYKGHDFYEPWFDRIDPAVINWIHHNFVVLDRQAPVFSLTDNSEYKTYNSNENK